MQAGEPGDAAITEPPAATTETEPPKPPSDPPGSRRRRAVRRIGLIDRTIPLLAAAVGLIALAGAVTVELRTEDRSRQIGAQVAELQAGIQRLEQRADGLEKAQDNGTIDALLALQDRIAKLEQSATAAAADAAATTAPASPAPTADALAQGSAAAAPTDPATEASSTPGTPAAGGGDCIPVGLRFMATPNQSYPLCDPTLVIKVGAIGDGTVDIGGAGTVTQTGFGSIPNSKCTVMVYSADPAGFAELKVTCG